MPYTPDGKGIMLEELASQITHVSLHTGAPGTTGANEVAGGAYARKTAAFAAFDDTDAIAINPAIEFDVPAATTVAYVGFWIDGTPDVFVGYDDLDEPETFGSAGKLTLTTSTRLRILDPS